jgi:PilZ domain
MYDGKLTNTKRWLKNRRSQRIELYVPVVVYRAPGEGPQFYENTQTIVVSAHGALMSLTDMVAPRQRLLVQNPNSGEHLECRVVSVKKELIGSPKVAVEFTRPAPSFWHIAFPPADWSASS